MARKDKYHEHVKEALANDGWKVTHDPYQLIMTNVKGKERKYPVDLGAEKLIAAEKGNQRIAVEVKTFGESSVMDDYHKALGQFMDYLLGLKIQEPERKLYVAVTQKIYGRILDNPLASLSIEHYQIPILLFDPITKKVLKWIR